MNERLPLWVFPALAFALLVNGLLFFLLPLLTQTGPSFSDMTEPMAVNSKTPRPGNPASSMTALTSRFVDVPMRVRVPPRIDA